MWRLIGRGRGYFPIGYYNSPKLKNSLLCNQKSNFKDENWIIYTWNYTIKYKTFTETSWPSILYYSK